MKKLIPSGLAVGLGLLAAWFDVASPWGDDTEKGTLLIWFVSGVILGVLDSHKPWRWALLVGPWVSIVHFARHQLGMPGSINPDTYATILILVPISFIVCTIGAYTGSWLRTAGAGADHELARDFSLKDK